MFGHPPEEWLAAKAEIREFLVESARRQRPVSYSELASRVVTIRFAPRDARLDTLLSEISEEEHRAGRGLLSVLVVHKSGDRRPGKGFFDCARNLGLDTSDEDILYADEMWKVFSSWGGGK